MEVYTEQEHTADYSIRLQAEDLPGLFIQAANALMELSGIQFEDASPEQRLISLEAMDLESLLVTWLEDLLYTIQTENLAWKLVGAVVEGFSLNARVDCVPVKHVQREIKAVTYHQLEVRREESGWTASLVLDV